MDGCAHKRIASSLGIAKREFALSYKDSKHEDKSTKCCNRIGCSTRLKSINDYKISNVQMAKCSRNVCSSSSKTIDGRSSLPIAAIDNLRKPHEHHRSRKAAQGIVLNKNSSKRTTLTADVTKGPLENPDAGSSVHQSSSLHTKEKEGSSHSSSNSTVRKRADQQCSLRSQDSSVRSLVQQSLLCRSTAPTAKPVTSGKSSIARRSALRNLAAESMSDSHTSGHSPSASSQSRRSIVVKKLRSLTAESISDIHTSGHSPSDPDQSRRSNVVRKKCSNSSYGENSPSVSRMSTKSSRGGHPTSQQKKVLAKPSLSFSESTSSQQAPHTSRYSSVGRTSGSSIRTQRAASLDMRSRANKHVRDNCSSPTQPAVVQELLQAESLVNESAPCSSPSSMSQNSHGELDSSNESLHRRPASYSEDSSFHSFHNTLVERESFRRVDDGIAEALLALERIGRDDDLTYEQLLFLETNLLLGGGHGFHDQHRDMRLDIDNMSYEELLALEERMGNVSTALSEEALSTCLERNFYEPTVLGLTACQVDDTKCSICQEGYRFGEEVGKLRCKHQYHSDCICQWLRLKNWCPICKASASTSTEESLLLDCA